MFYKIIRSSLKDSLIAALLVAILFIELIGIRTLDVGGKLGYQTRFDAVLYAAIIVFVGKMLFSLQRYNIFLPSFIIGFIGIVWLGIGLIFTDILDISHFLPFSEPILNWCLVLSCLVLIISGFLKKKGNNLFELSSLIKNKPQFQRHHFIYYLALLLIIVAFILPTLPFVDRVLIDRSILILTYIMLGWGLTIVVGLAGLLDLGYVAFYAVGAYSYALLSTVYGFNFWICLPIAGLLAASFGILLGLPVLRLRGDYLAIVTLGFGEMIRVILINWTSFSGGPGGINNIPGPSLFGFSFTRIPNPGTQSFHDFFDIGFSTTHRIIFLYYIILILALITNYISLKLRKLPIGRAWEALREDEIASRALGINPTKTKLTAFALGAMIAGFAGCFFATKQNFISPESFNFMESAIILAIVVLGGMGSQMGVILATMILIALPEFLRELELYRSLISGLVMVFIMVWRPKGLLYHREPTVRLFEKTELVFVDK
ncbi:MAG: high-affinity branched-chain amino acid ABC transporter permease LivM [Alphaproteobacteria bacterium]|nr:high-affinity branched-chain amino acid ABC transporter permease LivM [Alphaproteobacteria bacterium]